MRGRQQERRIQRLESSAYNPRYYRPSTPPRQSPSSSSMHFSYHLSSFKESTSPSTSTSIFASSSAGSGFDRTLGRQGHGSPPTPPADREDSLMYAMRFQRGYDDEDCALSVQRILLAKSAQMQYMYRDARGYNRPLDYCGHTFCRECLHRHVSAHIDDIGPLYSVPLIL